MGLFLAFLLVPLIEIALFIQIGGWLGLWPTLAIVVLTALAGTAMVRSQGLQVLGRLQARLSDGADPAETLVHGAMILFSGALLLTPGFFTDAVGFALLVPAVRTAVFAWLRARVPVHSVHMGHAGPARPRGPQDSHTIDGDFVEVDPDAVPPKRTDRPSGWTRP